MTAADQRQIIEFRDCVVEIEQGLVCRYTDKVQGVHLQPSEGFDHWNVYAQSGENTGQIWRGVIAFDGSQLLIQQARNSLFRLYKRDGTVETQLRITRVTERPGVRITVFPNDDFIQEELQTGVRRTFWGDRTVVHDSGGARIVYDISGNVIEGDSRETAESKLISAFADALINWQAFQPKQNTNEFHFGAPPGLADAPPGEPFQRACDDKPDDIRESITHRFDDGTVLHEYLGRLSNVPFSAHELLTQTGALLARNVEYDQPRNILFCDPAGIIREFADVQKVEMQFDPMHNYYVYCITSASGMQQIYPKGAKFERVER